MAFDWSERKGLNDWIFLSNTLSKTDYQIVLIGINEKQKQGLPEHIIAIPKTDSQEELAQWYSEAFVFVNPTYEDNFPSVNLEAQECATPVITYDTGGSVESVPRENVVPKGDVQGILNKIEGKKLFCKRGWNTRTMTSQYLELLR